VTVRSTSRAISALSASILVVGLWTAPADAAEPDPGYAWIVTADSSPLSSSAAAQPATPTPEQSLAKPQPRTSGQSRSARAALADDLKTACQSRPEATTAAGWTKDRFQQCFLGKRDIGLYSMEDGSRLARIIVDYSLLAFSYDGNRRVDYVFSFDDFDTEGGEPLPETTLTVAFSGCGGPVNCSPAAPARTELVPSWKLAADRTIQFTATTPQDTGDGLYMITRALIMMDMTVVSAAPRIQPWSEVGMASSRVRFDSAGAAGGGKFHGAVFSDNVPTVAFDRRTGSNHGEEAVHIDQALHTPQFTFPSFTGKSVPGEGSRPLHRLMDSGKRDANHAASQAICRSVWGANYTTGGRECDEYPFQSVYEGSSTSTAGNPARWNGSARPISATHNSNGGNHLKLFYGLNRILDENEGTAQAGTPSDPFLVTVLK
jgi:hypothetical protein